MVAACGDDDPPDLPASSPPPTPFSARAATRIECVFVCGWGGRVARDSEGTDSERPAGRPPLPRGSLDRGVGSSESTALLALSLADKQVLPVP